MCSGENYSCAITIIISLLLGVLAGILFFLGILTEVTIALIISLVIAFLVSIFLFVLIIIPRYNSCIRNASCCIVIGLIGVIITTVIALSIDLSALSIISAILIGIVVFFLSLMIIKFFQLISCVIKLNNDDSEESDCNCNCNNNNNNNNNRNSCFRCF